jgi:putative FmdB family regulatory protein
MPTYDYRCENGHTFELFHSIKDDSTKHCPECGAPAKRVPSAGGGLLFKGSGFYITDYRSKGYQERAKADKPGGEKSGGEGGSGKKGESPSPKPSGGDSGGGKPSGGSSSSGSGQT